MAMTKREKQAKKYIDPYRKEAVGDALKLRQQQAQDTRKTYDNAIFETGRAYEDDYRENAVQKAINERQVAESMANMGLTDSGLNRTQATAVQLSYGNNKAAIDRAKRKAQDSLELEKTGKLSTIRQNWLADKASINQTYDKYEADYAASLEDADAKRYAAQVEANSKIAEALAKSSYIIPNDGATLSRNMQGTLAGNNVTILAQKNDDGEITGYKYVDNNSGKSTVVSAGVNPYTGEDNYEKYKKIVKTRDDFFENGYQPKKVYVDGTNYGYVSYSGVNGEINGNEQRVHKTNDGSYWIWDRNNNSYVKFETHHKHLDGQGNPWVSNDWSDKEWIQYFNEKKNADGEKIAYDMYEECIKYGWIPDAFKKAILEKCSFLSGR